jgi:hypothetical protein
MSGTKEEKIEQILPRWPDQVFSQLLILLPPSHRWTLFQRWPRLQ